MKAAVTAMALIALAGRDVTLLRPDELMRMADYQSPPALDTTTN